MELMRALEARSAALPPLDVRPLKGESWGAAEARAVEALARANEEAGIDTAGEGEVGAPHRGRVDSLLVGTGENGRRPLLSTERSKENKKSAQKRKHFFLLPCSA